MYTLNSIIEIVCFCLALFFLKNEKKTWWGHFVWFLLLTVIVELAGFVIGFVFLHNNYLLYALFMPVSVVFTSWILYKCCSEYFNCRKWIMSGLAIFPVLYLYETFYPLTESKYMIVTNLFICVFFIVTCCLYYYYLLKNDDYFNLLKDPPFWIVTGIFVYYFGKTGTIFFFEYLVRLNLVAIGNAQLKPVRFFIMAGLNFILYGCWSYAFVCRSRYKISNHWKISS
jgi:hypothetical protein